MLSCSGSSSTEERCQQRKYAPESLISVTCTASQSSTTLLLQANACWGPPDDCTFTVNGSEITIEMVKEFCDNGQPASTGCAGPSVFRCTGPVLTEGTYAFKAESIFVSSDGSCSL